MTSALARKARVFAHRVLPFAGARVDGVGQILDVYPWFVEPGLDTLVPVHNWFGAFFPNLDTTTEAVVDVLDSDGGMVARHTTTVPHLGVQTVRVSDLLQDQGRPAYGSVVWHLATPRQVAAAITNTEDSFFFWDRSYIGYETPRGTAFIHGVDKTEIVEPSGRRRPWPDVRRRRSFSAHPEIPVVFDEYERLDVILQNRATRSVSVELSLVDAEGRRTTRLLSIGPRGTCCEAFRRIDLSDLALDRPLRIEASGLPTRYGRPIVLKRFPNGAISLMHC